MDKCTNLNCAFRHYCSKRNTNRQFTPPCQDDNGKQESKSEDKENKDDNNKET